jgi:hypothetical protein
MLLFRPTKEKEQGMIRSAASKVMWVGRATVFLVGFSVILGLVFGVATTALSATGGTFILGKANGADRVSKLTASIAGPALTLVNQSTEAAATALNINVASGQPPLKVNAAAGTATNLSADELDGKDESAFASSSHNHDGSYYAAGSKVADSTHADHADSATNAQNADKLDGQDSTTLLPGGDLPKDRTLRGHYNVYDKASPQQGGQENMPISFGYRLASAPTVRIIKANTSPPAECPGTASAPEAASGYLCIYETSSYNLYNSPYRTYPYVYGTSRIGTHIAADSTVNNHTTYDSTFYTYGTWAVTGN